MASIWFKAFSVYSLPIHPCSCSISPVPPGFGCPPRPLLTENPCTLVEDASGRRQELLIRHFNAWRGGRETVCDKYPPLPSQKAWRWKKRGVWRTRGRLNCAGINWFGIHVPGRCRKHHPSARRSCGSRGNPSTRRRSGCILHQTCLLVSLEKGMGWRWNSMDEVKVCWSVSCCVLRMSCLLTAARGTHSYCLWEKTRSLIPHGNGPTMPYIAFSVLHEKRKLNKSRWEYCDDPRSTAAGTCFEGMNL